VNFKDETNINGDLRNESQKTQAERLKLQTENFKSYASYKSDKSLHTQK
jgi:hypothetical protein